MTSLMSHIREGVRTQHAHTALTNCFATWDDSEPCQEVIEQGICDRFRAMGIKSPGVRLDRETLNTTVLEVADMDAEEVIFRAHFIGSDVSSKGVYYVKGNHSTLAEMDFFHLEEIFAMKKFMGSFYRVH